MGIRYEKDTILNWINEMGKFLRLVVNRWEGLDELEDSLDVEDGYRDFFQKDRAYFLALDGLQLTAFIQTLEPEQVRPLALLMMYDGFLLDDKNLLENAKLVLEWNMGHSGSFAFEDYAHLTKITQFLSRL